MQYKVCPSCGAHLDSGERCDCKNKEAAPLARMRPLMKTYIPILSAHHGAVNDGRRQAHGA